MKNTSKNKLKSEAKNAIEQGTTERKLAPNVHRFAPAHGEPVRPAPAFKAKRLSDVTPNTSCKNYLVKGIIERGDLGVIYGAPAAGKTFVTLAMAGAIAMGKKAFLDHRVRQCAVLYITLEGKRGFEKRLEAMQRDDDYHGEKTPLFYNFCKGADFRHDSFVQGIEDTIKEQNIELVIIDTLARFLGDADENSTGGINKALDFADQIITQTGAAVLFVHHSGKDATKGPRGSSALRGAVDCEIALERDNDGRRLKLSKVKDDVDEQEHEFNLRIVDLPPDEEGDPRTTCIAQDFAKVDAASKASNRKAQSQAAHNAQMAMECILDASINELSETVSINGGPKRRGFNRDTIVALCIERGLFSSGNFSDSGKEADFSNVTKPVTFEHKKHPLNNNGAKAFNTVLKRLSSEGKISFDRKSIAIEKG